MSLVTFEMDDEAQDLMGRISHPAKMANTSSHDILNILPDEVEGIRWTTFGVCVLWPTIARWGGLSSTVLHITKSGSRC